MSLKKEVENIEERIRYEQHAVDRLEYELAQVADRLRVVKSNLAGSNRNLHDARIAYAFSVEADNEADKAV